MAIKQAWYFNWKIIYRPIVTLTRLSNEGILGKFWLPRLQGKWGALGKTEESKFQFVSKLCTIGDSTFSEKSFDKLRDFKGKLSQRKVDYKWSWNTINIWIPARQRSDETPIWYENKFIGWKRWPGCVLLELKFDASVKLTERNRSITSFLIRYHSNKTSREHSYYL